MGFGAINKWRRVFGTYFGIGISNDIGSVLSNDPDLKVNAVGHVNGGAFAHASSIVLNVEGAITGVFQSVVQKDINKSVGSSLMCQADNDDLSWSITEEIQGNPRPILVIKINKQTDFINYCFNHLSEYVDHAAADSDTALYPNAIYKLTGDRTIYQKP